MLSSKYSSGTTLLSNYPRSERSGIAIHVRSDLPEDEVLIKEILPVLTIVLER
jgi:hypothetical protein